MAKIVTALLGIAMIAHVIRPFGLPGLTRRVDAWKLGILAILLVAVITAIRPD